MKIKLDFISNSSSTSFVYISDIEMTEELFLKAVGVDRYGPVGDLFLEMHYELTSALHRGNKITSSETAENLAGSHEYTPEVIEKMKAAITEGKNVVTGTLSSESSMAESLLCTAMFEIDSDEFYINAYSNYW